MRTFEEYLIEIGIRSNSEYTYSNEELYENIEYFRKCYNEQLSVYKALLYLDAHINYNEDESDYEEIK